MFSSVNYFGALLRKSNTNVSKKMKLREVTVPRYVKMACDAVGTVGKGVRKYMTAHCL